MEQQTVTLIVGLGGVIVGGLITWVTNLFTNKQRFKHELEMLEKRLEHEEKERGLKLKQEKIAEAYELIGKIKDNINDSHLIFFEHHRKIILLDTKLNDLYEYIYQFSNTSHPYVLEISDKVEHILEVRSKLLSFYMVLKRNYEEDKEVDVEEKHAVSFVNCLESIQAIIEDAEYELDNLVVSLNIVPTAPEFKRKVESHTEQPSS